MLEKQGLRAAINTNSFERLGTFLQNKSTPIHNWFSYTEGFSCHLIKHIIQTLAKKPEIILDPFSGSATTGVEAILSNCNFQGYDINPAMRIVAEAKTVSSIGIASMIRNGKLNEKRFIELVTRIITPKGRKILLKDIFSEKPYFSLSNLRQIDNIKQNIDAYIDDVNLQNIFLAALLGVLVNVSNLKRSPDLKYRAEDDWNRPSTNSEFKKKCFQIFRDLQLVSEVITTGRASNYVGTAKNLHNTDSNSIDLIITSPPYLNGTNYIRNTKLELWVAGVLKEAGDLKGFRKQEISSGINSAQKLETVESEFSKINQTIERIQEKAYDPRITPMVAHYFEDMSAAIKNMYRVLKRNRKLFMVVGDSAFNNVHIPTDLHLGLISKSVGFELKAIQVLRKRRSRGGMALREVLMILEK